MLGDPRRQPLRVGTSPRSSPAVEDASTGDNARMATIVFVHAHPDDEATLTSGSMARASAEGHRVVTVYATGGEHGEVPGDLAPGESLADRRRREAGRSAEALGVHRLVWLGYADSGMSGWEQNTDEASLARADLVEAAARLAAVLEEEGADVVVGYDWHGNYGHPDHVRVHHVVRRALDFVVGRRPRLLEATMNRDRMRRLLQQARDAGPDADAGVEGEADWDVDAPMQDGNPLGTPEAELAWEVDVTPYLAQRRASLAAHASQATDTQRALAMDPEVFAVVYGYEYFLEPSRQEGMRRGWFLDE